MKKIDKKKNVKRRIRSTRESNTFWKDSYKRLKKNLCEVMEVDEGILDEFLVARIRYLKDKVFNDSTTN